MKLSLDSCCPASNFSSDCYGDQPVFMYVICAGPTNCRSFQLVIGSLPSINTRFNQCNI